MNVAKFSRPILEKISAKNEVRFLAEALLQMWVDELDIEATKEFASLKRSDLPLDQKIEKAKELARDVAYEMLNDLCANAEVKIDWSGLEIDFQNDSVDWAGLFSNEIETEGSQMIGRIFEGFLKRAVAAGLELLTKTSEDEWYSHLKELDQQTPLDDKAVRDVFNHVVWSVQRDISKIDPAMWYINDYNSLKRAFDKIAKEKGVQKWHYGTSMKEWLLP